MLVPVALLPLCAALAVAIPQGGRGGGPGRGPPGTSPAPSGGLVSKCDPSGLNNGIPAGAALTPTPDPATQPLLFVGLGQGSQNYSCVNTTYTSVGAVATLFDASCNASPDVSTSGLTKLGDHYFQQTSAGLSPVFDFRARGGANAFIVAKKSGSIPSPDDPATDVAWLSLVTDPTVDGTGTLAQTVYRLQTRGGQPPTTCDASSPPVQIPYHALYWFYGAPATKPTSSTTPTPSATPSSTKPATSAKPTQTGRPGQGGGFPGNGGGFPGNGGPGNGNGGGPGNGNGGGPGRGGPGRGGPRLRRAVRNAHVLA